MILITIILVSLIVLGFILSRYFKTEILGITLVFIFVVLFIIHIIGWVFIDINYSRISINRNILQTTLDSARKNNKKFELAITTFVVIEFNNELALKKYYNTKPVIKYYIDNRVDKLKPIK